MDKKSIFLVAISLMFLTGCASYFTRKKCESTNWYNYGHNIAMKGKRLNSDDFIKNCEKAEAQINHQELDLGFKKGMAQYCLPGEVYKTGKKGQPFSPDLCDPSDIPKLKAQHQKGVLIFCTPDNGYQVGAKGDIYTNVCPENLESAFIKKYNKGRVVFLKGKNQDMLKEVSSLNRELSKLESKNKAYNMQLTALQNSNGGPSIIVSDGSVQLINLGDTSTPKAREQAIRRLESEIRSVKYEIRKKRDRQQEINSQVSKNNTEIRALAEES